MQFTSQKLEQYQKACNELAAEFLLEYYPLVTADDFYWIAQDIGGLLSVGDEIYGMDAIAHAMESRPSKPKLQKWYEENLKGAQIGEIVPNLKKWLKIHRNER